MIDQEGNPGDLEAFHSRRNPDHVVIVVTQNRQAVANLLLDREDVVRLREELWTAMNRAWPNR